MARTILIGGLMALPCIGIALASIVDAFVREDD